MNKTQLDLKPDATTEPMIRLALQIIKDAVVLNADEILLELDVDLHLKVHQEMESLMQLFYKKKLLTADEFFFKMDRLPNAFQISHSTNGIRDQKPSANGELFGNVTRILLLATEVPPWTKGEISAPLETINPVSKWMFESKDLTRQVQLRRIRAT